MSIALRTSAAVLRSFLNDENRLTSKSDLNFTCVTAFDTSSFVPPEVFLPVVVVGASYERPPVRIEVPSTRVVS